MAYIRRLINRVKFRVSDDYERRRKQLYFLEYILGIVCVFMSVLNILQEKDMLLIFTLFGAVSSFANTIILSKFKKRLNLATIIFIAKIFILFTYFIIAGGTEGFSTIWLVLLPAFAPFAFGLKKGSILSLSLLLELMIFFYTPLKDVAIICEDYTASFLLRFPILYTSCFFLGIYLEFIREQTNKRLILLQKQVEYQSKHDQLTSLNNRYGFKNEVDSYVKEYKYKKFGLLILDIDRFKEVNDTYGHIIGDKVLAKIARRIDSIDASKIVACRWGGEEFAIFVKNNEDMSLFDIAEKVRLSISEPMIIDDITFNITVSVGCVCSNEFNDYEVIDDFVKLIEIADKRLYQAKNSGRNITVCSNACKEL